MTIQTGYATQSLDSHQNKTPVLLYDPGILKDRTRRFLSGFPGDVAYAVKANPDNTVLSDFIANGITAFDVSSLDEIERLRDLSREVELLYMHPVKSRSEILDAYFRHGVRAFAVDSIEEVRKISQCLPGESGIEIFCRLKVDQRQSEADIDLDTKFGAPQAQAAHVVQTTSAQGYGLSLAFNVGSQQRRAEAYGESLRALTTFIDSHALPVKRVSVGGGFPVFHDGPGRLDLAPYFEEIRRHSTDLRDRMGVRLVAEPGRALVAECLSLLTRVKLVRGGDVFIDDGIYGTLLDAALLGVRYALRLARPCSGKHRPFHVFGPTCDSLDKLPGSYHLPEDIAEGDVIEIRNVGAYGRTLTNNFNGLSGYASLCHLAGAEVADREQQSFLR